MTAPPADERSLHAPPENVETCVSTSSSRSSPNPPVDGSSWQLAHDAELNDGPSPFAEVKTRLNTARPRLNRSSSAAVRPASGRSSCSSSETMVLLRTEVGERFGDEGGGLSVQAMSRSAIELANTGRVSRRIPYLRFGAVPMGVGGTASHTAAHRRRHAIALSSP